MIDMVKYANNLLEGIVKMQTGDRKPRTEPDEVWKEDDLVKCRWCNAERDVTDCEREEYDRGYMYFCDKECQEDYHVDIMLKEEEKSDINKTTTKHT